MVHSNMFPKAIVSVDVKPIKMKYDFKLDEVNDDVQPDEVNDDVKPSNRLIVVEESRKLGFIVVIKKSDNGSNIRQAFITMICERSGTYQPRIRKLKQDVTRSRKYECPFKLHGYHMTDETWKLNVISGIHNHALTDKLVGHPIVCRIVLEERKLISDMTLNMVASKNILASLK
ncbi:uncharacterized protein LOC127136999 [Lathyrus oleraceus]|uniref:uncharacterized protein LOC127136999 n=1 Tax=Pisum sativum TaxID=3888 RepID=UPI0021D39BA3|nr:uncharacterized protein LOC127136999 [Pisum sativum]